MNTPLRGLSRFVTGAAFVAFAFLAPNCQPTGGEQINPGSGGSEKGGSGGKGSGGDGSGGSSEKGGSGGSETGGTTSSSGGSNTGGSSAKGGSGGSARGGSGGSARGGSAGSSARGGSSGSGGSGSGGTTTTPTTAVSSGGTTGSTTGTGTSTGNEGTVVAFGNGKGQGAMTGYAYVALGSKDTISDPTCGTSETEITSAAPCKSGTNWNATDKLCMTGSIPALDATNPDYTGNWGVSVGLNATDPEGGGLGQAFSSVTITLSGTPTSGLRAIVHIKGESADTQYCSPLTSGTAISFTDFSATCWDTAAPGTKVTAAQVASIDKIAVQVNSGSSAITVSNLCITKIEFAK
ncbi:MAG: hypothetical protein JXP73_00770 [Deltaproteobacteria bacterium]|nr:hypothetical protein [Deltaproteobacteria bacterium]